MDCLVPFARWPLVDGTGMPPRRSACRTGTPILGSDPYESIESRLKRLRPDDTQTHTAVPATTRGTPVPRASPPIQASIPARSDAPVVRNLRRGAIADAAAAVASIGMAALVANLISDRVAPSAVGSSTSLLRTWTAFHSLAFADSATLIPLLPITDVILQYVGALFKSGGYRSFANYLSAAKAMHIEAGYEWTQLLAHTATWVTRSVLRGIGPARQSCSFNFVKLCRLTCLPDPLVTNGPQQPQHLAILATIFLLREVEASVAKLSAWTFDLELLELTWNLPGTKTDPKALGVPRT